MTESLTFPTPSEVLKRIEACRAELATLKKLLKLSVAAAKILEEPEPTQVTDEPGTDAA